tara:strand:+ start:7580 stop:7855 length:276 start_codon:yes stop_codon:yes gene_type:complete
MHYVDKSDISGEALRLNKLTLDKAPVALAAHLEVIHPRHWLVVGHAPDLALINSRATKQNPKNDKSACSGSSQVPPNASAIAANGMLTLMG